MSCCCPSLDAIRCVEMRTRSSRDLTEDDVDPDDARCECACHEPDEGEIDDDWRDGIDG